MIWLAEYTSTCQQGFHCGRTKLPTYLEYNEEKDERIEHNVGPQDYKYNIMEYAAFVYHEDGNIL